MRETTKRNKTENALQTRPEIHKEAEKNREKKYLLNNRKEKQTVTLPAKPKCDKTTTLMKAAGKLWWPKFKRQKPGFLEISC